MCENKLNFPNGKYIFIWGWLDQNAGGMTRVMLDRVCRFKRQGLDVSVLLGGRGLEQYEAVLLYKENGFDELQVENFKVMEDWLANKLSDPDILCNTNHNELFQCEKLFYVQGNDSIDIYENGILIEKIWKKNEIIVKRAKYYLDEIDPYIIEYYYKGDLRKAFLTGKGSKKYELFFAKNGFCFMSVCIDTATNNEINVKLFNQKTNECYSYKNLDEVRKYFYRENITSDPFANVFVFNDPVPVVPSGFEDFMGDNVYKIAINHSVGLWDERNWNSRLTPRIVNLIDVYSSELDAFISLTEPTTQTFVHRAGNRNIFKTIPNATKLNPHLNKSNKRNIMKGVYIGRFSKEKQCDHVLKAFKIVHEKCPDALIELYGRGDCEKDLIKEIKDEGLGKYVIVKSFTKDIEKIFSEASFSVITSGYQVESFCLALIESLANGCPVLTYKMKFGVSNIIKDGINGYQIEPDNINELAEKIITMIQKSDEELNNMYLNAYESAKKFDLNEYERNWCAVLNEIIEQKKYRCKLQKINVCLNHILINDEGEITVKGEMLVEGTIPNCAFGKEKIYLRCYEKDKSEYVAISCNFQLLEEMKYSFETDLFKAKSYMSICYELTNSFVEYDISEDLQKFMKQTIIS